MGSASISLSDSLSAIQPRYGTVGRNRTCSLICKGKTQISFSKLTEALSLNARNDSLVGETVRRGILVNKAEVKTWCGDNAGLISVDRGHGLRPSTWGPSKLGGYARWQDSIPVPSPPLSGQ